MESVMNPNQLCSAVNKIDQKVRAGAGAGREVAQLRAAIKRAEQKAIQAQGEGARMCWLAKATALRDMLDAALDGAL
jgi:hypothetical protein